MNTKGTFGELRFTNQYRPCIYQLVNHGSGYARAIVSHHYRATGGGQTSSKKQVFDGYRHPVQRPQRLAIGAHLIQFCSTGQRLFREHHDKTLQLAIQLRNALLLVAGFIVSVLEPALQFNEVRSLLLKPLLLGRGVDAPMPIILLGALGGMVTSGIIGLFVGAVLLAVGYQIFMEWVAEGDTAGAQPAGARAAEAPPLASE